MSETTPKAGEIDFGEAGRLLFAQPCDFIWAAAKIDGLPPMGPLEIAFAGRSNVGKSSLLNGLTNRKTLARTSNTPGRTQQLNFFALGEPDSVIRLRLVDMPGYGYAAVSKTKVADWTMLMEGYLRGRSTLARVYLLVDGRHGVKGVDLEMMDVLDRAAMSYQIILTKRDEVKLSAQASTLKAMQEVLARRAAAHPDVMFVSSQSFEGIPDLRAGIARLLHERGAL